MALLLVVAPALGRSPPTTALDPLGALPSPSPLPSPMPELKQLQPSEQASAKMCPGHPRIHLNSTACPSGTNWSQKRASPAELVENLTLDEQLGLLHGSCTTGLHIGDVCGVKEKNIPGLALSDGPQGVVAETFSTAIVSRVGTSTAWPCALALAATWDTDAVERWGDALGREFKLSGTNVALGPCLNVARVPYSGRVFESLSGEDPYLGATLVRPAVRAIQHHGVIATAKHFALNDQELDRGTVSAVADERTRFEMHYPPFAAAVDAGVGAFMCSYNKLSIDGGKHTWACENPKLLKTDLRERLGFKGFIMSDWAATHSVAIEAGLDMEMDERGDARWFGEPLAEAVTTGTVSYDAVRKAAQHILEPIVRLGVQDATAEAKRVEHSAAPFNVSAAGCGSAHARLATELATQSIVLLQNDAVKDSDSKTKARVLPLDPKEAPLRLVLVGAEAAAPTVLGGGSGAVVPATVSSPLAALRSRLGLAPPERAEDECDARKESAGWALKSASATEEPSAGLRVLPPNGRPTALVLAAPDERACCMQCASRNRMLKEAKSQLLGCDSFNFDGAICHMKMTEPPPERKRRVAARARRRLRSHRGGGAAAALAQGFEDPGAFCAPGAPCGSVQNAPAPSSVAQDAEEPSSVAQDAQELSRPRAFDDAPSQDLSIAAQSDDVPSSDDLLCYAARYSDVKRTYGKDTEALLRHWTEYGQFEGRNPYCDEDAAAEEDPDCNKAGDVCVTHVDGSDVAAAAAAVQGASAALVFVAASSTEKNDRDSLEIDGNVDQLIRAVAEANPRTVVCVVAPGVVMMPWRDKVAAITLAFLPGQAYGDALAALLLGELAPSAKLPITLPANEWEPAFEEEQYPGTLHGMLEKEPEEDWLKSSTGQQRVVNYTEGLLVGYRWFDAHNVAPAFAFGHGLTYTSFELDNLTVSSEMVSCHVRNSGERDGVETLQLYLGLPAEAKAPPLQLKGFAKVKLNPGERKPVHFPLTTRSRSTWDAAVHAWREVSGRVEVVVGTSSRDEAALTGHFNVS